MNINSLLLADFYKIGHVHQYPKGVERIWVNWTPRSSRTPVKGVYHFGLQYFIKEYLINQFEHSFFNRPYSLVRNEYREVIQATLGIDPPMEHIERLHQAGRLPITIYTLPEGEFVPVGVPAMVIVNTEDHAYWLPNFLETILSAVLWKASTSATTSAIYRDIFVQKAKEFGETDLAFTQWQGHDFSFRGMTGTEDAFLSGMGHLTSFSGTDTIPAILAAREYYSAPLTCGGSVPATEHSVMCAGKQDGEFETFKRLITETYPAGIVSIVSDTWDLWRVLTDYIPRLKETILARNGKIVIRPDSGDPVKIMVGDPASSNPHARRGVLGLLADVLGTDGKGHIRNAGAIYGDSITPERAELILTACIRDLHLSPYNCVFGIGSYTYQYCTRDTYGFAMKATAVQQDGELIPIFKDPVTDNGLKKSHFGIPAVHEMAYGYAVEQNVTPDALDNCAFEKVFENGRWEIETSLNEIRERKLAHQPKLNGGNPYYVRD